jgi:hypothetical protein
MLKVTNVLPTQRLIESCHLVFNLEAENRRVDMNSLYPLLTQFGCKLGVFMER